MGVSVGVGIGVGVDIGIGDWYWRGVILAWGDIGVGVDIGVGIDIGMGIDIGVGIPYVIDDGFGVGVNFESSTLALIYISMLALF